MLARDSIKPKKNKRGHSEYDLQCKCVEWFRHCYPDFIIYSVPNEACFRAKTKYEKSGLLSGVADLMVVLPNVVLWIEMKSENGRQRKEQKDFQKKIETLGYRYYLCRTLDNFKDIIINNL